MNPQNTRTRSSTTRPALLATAAAAMAMLSLPVLAQQPATGSQEAAQAQAKVEFSRGNQEITVRSVMPPQVANASDYQVSFDDLDTEGRGYITRDQVPEEHALYHEFHLVDRDRNGRITREELQNWR